MTKTFPFLVIVLLFLTAFLAIITATPTIPLHNTQSLQTGITFQYQQLPMTTESTVLEFQGHFLCDPQIAPCSAEWNLTWTGFSPQSDHAIQEVQLYIYGLETYNTTTLVLQDDHCVQYATTLIFSEAVIDNVVIYGYVTYNATFDNNVDLTAFASEISVKVDTALRYRMTIIPGIIDSSFSDIPQSFWAFTDSEFNHPITPAEDPSPFSFVTPHFQFAAPFQKSNLPAEGQLFDQMKLHLFGFFKWAHRSTIDDYLNRTVTVPNYLCYLNNFPVTALLDGGSQAQGLVLLITPEVYMEVFSPLLNILRDFPQTTLDFHCANNYAIYDHHQMIPSQPFRPREMLSVIFMNTVAKSLAPLQPPLTWAWIHAADVIELDQAWIRTEARKFLNPLPAVSSSDTRVIYNQNTLPELIPLVSDEAINKNILDHWAKCSFAFNTPSILPSPITSVSLRGLLDFVLYQPDTLPYVDSDSILLNNTFYMFIEPSQRAYHFSKGTKDSALHAFTRNFTFISSDNSTKGTSLFRIHTNVTYNLPYVPEYPVDMVTLYFPLNITSTQDRIYPESMRCGLDVTFISHSESQEETSQITNNFMIYQQLETVTPLYHLKDSPALVVSEGKKMHNLTFPKTRYLHLTMNMTDSSDLNDLRLITVEMLNGLHHFQDNNITVCEMSVVEVLPDGGHDDSYPNPVPTGGVDVTVLSHPFNNTFTTASMTFAISSTYSPLNASFPLFLTLSCPTLKFINNNVDVLEDGSTRGYLTTTNQFFEHFNDNILVTVHFKNETHSVLEQYNNLPHPFPYSDIASIIVLIIICAALTLAAIILAFIFCCCRAGTRKIVNQHRQPMNPELPSGNFYIPPSSPMPNQNMGVN